MNSAVDAGIYEKFRSKTFTTRSDTSAEDPFEICSSLQYKGPIVDLIKKDLPVLQEILYMYIVLRYVHLQCTSVAIRRSLQQTRSI